MNRSEAAKRREALKRVREAEILVDSRSPNIRTRAGRPHPEEIVLTGNGQSCFLVWDAATQRWRERIEAAADIRSDAERTHPGTLRNSLRRPFRPAPWDQGKP